MVAQGKYLNGARIHSLHFIVFAFNCLVPVFQLALLYRDETKVHGRHTEKVARRYILHIVEYQRRRRIFFYRNRHDAHVTCDINWFIKYSFE